jgi:hypothetical protein
LKITLKATVYLGPPVAGKRRTPSANRTLGIQIGPICCALRCPDDELYDRLGGLYGNFLTEQPADVTIDLKRISGGDDDGAGDKPALSVLQDKPDRFIAALECNPTESGRGFEYMNRLFYMAYYSSCLEKYGGSPAAMLMHACGILRRERALVFSGPSESGKTTIAGLCGEHDGQVISDEMVLVYRPSAEGGTNVQSVPILGTFAPGMNVTVPLGCILMLKKGEQTRVHPVNQVDAYLRLIRQIITPSYIGQREIKTALSLVADFGLEIINNIPVYELEFTTQRDSLWQEIGELEGELGDKLIKR